MDVTELNMFQVVQPVFTGCLYIYRPILLSYAPILFIDPCHLKDSNNAVLMPF